MRLLALVLGLTVVSACSAPLAPPTRAALEARVAANPEDAEAFRDLGALHALEDNYGPALGAFSQALALEPTDGQTLYFVGLANEALGREADAEDAYAQYLSVDARDVYRDSLRSRLNALVRQRLQQEFAQALTTEDEVADVAGTGAIGVLPFVYRGDNEEYAALGRGLAEVLAADLASVNPLTVVERSRLQALLAEYELARQGVLDPSTVPRTGQLLRADKLVGGEVDVQGDNLRIESAVWQGGLRDIATEEGTIAELFQVQKTITLGVLAALGVAVPEADRAALLAPPTADLIAFLLYSRALLREDAGDFAGAVQLYNEALERDPGFALAAQARGEASLSQSAQRPAAPTLTTTAETTIEFAAPSVSTAPLVQSRSDALREALGGHLTPSTETREPGVEGSRVGVLGRLPNPPPPPPPPPGGSRP